MLVVAFLLCLGVHVMQGVLHCKVTLLAFSPFIALSLLKKKGKMSLWLAMVAGLWVDFFSDDPMGLHALNYVATSVLVYGVKKRLSEEEPIHLSLYTVVISWVSTVVQIFLLFLFDRRVPIDGKWTLIDIFCMPVVDGMYALIWLSGPLLLWQRLHYKWIIYWIKKKNLSLLSR